MNETVCLCVNKGITITRKIPKYAIAWTSRLQRLLGRTKEYRSKKMKLQCETRRYYFVETNGNAHGTCTPTSGHVSARETDQWKLRYCRRDQPGREFKRRCGWSQRGTRHDDQKLFKWNSQNEPAASAWIRIGGNDQGAIRCT